MANDSVTSYLSTQTIDRVIFSVELTITDASFVYTLHNDVTKIGNQTAYPLSLVSYDNGQTWSDFRVSCNVDGSVSFAAATAPALIRICLLALDTPTDLLPGTTAQSGVTALATTDKQHNPAKYRTIQGGQYNFNAGAAPGATTVAHGLNYIPDMGIWASLDSTVPNAITPLLFNSNISGTVGIMVDSTNMYFMKFLSTTRYHYRLYKP